MFDRKALPWGFYVAMLPPAAAFVIALGWVVDRMLMMGGG